jgi:hypothetical protein
MHIFYNTLIDLAIVAAAGALTWALISYFMHNPARLPLSMVIARPRMSAAEKKVQREKVLRLCADGQGRNQRRPWDGPTGNPEK